MKKQYIDKAALKAEIERIEYETNYEPFTEEVLGKRKVCKDIKDFLDTLEEVEEPSKDLDGYKEVSFELIPYSANIAVGGNEYFLQAKVTDKDLSQIGVSGFLYKLKLKVKA